MDATLLFHLNHHHYPLQHYNHSPHDSHYQPVMSSHSSYIRSSAPRPIHPILSQYSSSYPPPLAADSPSSSGSGSNPTDSSPSEPPLDYVMEAEYDSATASGGHFYSGEHVEAQQNSWSTANRHPPLTEVYPGSTYDMSATVPAANMSDIAMMNQYLKHEEPAYAVFDDYSHYGFGADASLASYATVAGHPTIPNASVTPNSMSTGPPPSLAFGFGTQAHPQGQVQDAADMPAYTLTSLPDLQYPPSPNRIPRYVHPAQVSPAAGYAQLQDMGADNSCDPRFTMNSPQVAYGSASPGTHSGSGSADCSPELARALVESPVQSARKRRCVSFTSSSSSDSYPHGDSGESERDESDGADEDLDDDEDYVQGFDSHPRTRRRAVSMSSHQSQTPTRRLAAPVPVPNLTKKSRGRRVPTAAVVISQDGVEKNMRTYMCKVPGCGKCFARGEHLKRHVRSIHTNEKPHKCPFPGCGKDFSRHDNLGQHMRVHKNRSGPKNRSVGPA
ncbi:hypothetical protein AcV5_005308 [Taiwanofungus camphoratus]|nr:hypothetical protein AcV5_005308 [Antrodia cinnamomea]